MEIRCKKDDCKHNTGCSCRAGEIRIDRGEHCASYVRNQLKDNLIRENGNIFAVADDMAKQHLRTVPLACCAKECIYNKERRCHANGITVVDGKNDTCADCATFCAD